MHMRLNVAFLPRFFGSYLKKFVIIVKWKLVNIKRLQLHLGI